ncbi:MAG TPA: SAM-dependent methyltransferase [Cytophagales bacterium]|nr:SAM-dependent methyltransferase [Cytophagales bacterium]HAP61290.1 SAM-dependent methyltransferase [Cytophagales bacterium]
MKPLYDEIGKAYVATRRTDPRIADQLHAELAGATKIINIGAGAGSYEPEGIDLIAVEPSTKMIAQRPKEAHPVVKASAEALPFEDNSFSHALTILSIHHWQDQTRGFREINRVTTHKFIALTWDPTAEPFWLTRDYFPEGYAMDLKIFSPLEYFDDHFEEVKVTPLLIPHDCQDGFLAAYWKRPQAYLDPVVRQSISTFAKLDDVTEGLQKLETDLNSGAWADRNQDLLEQSELDAGYRIVTAKVR